MQNIYTTGSFNDTADFNPNGGTFNIISNGSTDCFLHRITNGTFTGISQNELPYNIDIYPNPVKDRLNIEFKSNISQCDLTLYNSLGQIVYFQKSEFQRKEIDLTAFQSGIYFLTLQSNSERKTIKILKQ